MLLLAIMLIFIGFQFVSLGLIAELQARTYHESQNKAVYFVRSVFRKEPMEGLDPGKDSDAAA
jgi:uncharacterized membrane protein